MSSPPLNRGNLNTPDFYIYMVLVEPVSASIYIQLKYVVVPSSMPSTST
jgi:hypothetical protein